MYRHAGTCAGAHGGRLPVRHAQTEKRTHAHTHPRAHAQHTWCTALTAPGSVGVPVRGSRGDASDRRASARARVRVRARARARARARTGFPGTGTWLASRGASGRTAAWIEVESGKARPSDQPITTHRERTHTHTCVCTKPRATRGGFLSRGMGDNWVKVWRAVGGPRWCTAARSRDPWEVWAGQHRCRTFGRRSKRQGGCGRWLTG